MKLLKSFLFCFLFVQPLIIYSAHYDQKNCDDKAVHYYSSMMMFAPAEAQQTVLSHMPQWILKESDPSRKDRVSNRLTSFYNYPLTATLIKIESIASFEQKPYEKNFHLASRQVKIAFFVSFLLALIFVLWIAWQTPLGLWPILLAINFASFRFMRFGIRSFWLKNYGLIAYPPRGSVTVLILAILLTYAAQRKRLFIISCLLLCLWHQGLALLACFILFPSLLISELLATYFSKKFIARFVLINSSFLAIGCLFTVLATQPQMQAWLGHYVPAHLIADIPARLSGIFYLILCVLLSLAVWHILIWALSKTPANKDLFIFTGSLLAICVFLFSMRYFYKDKYSQFYTGRTQFFHDDCPDVKSRPVNRHSDLSALQPQMEDGFFYSIANYIRTCEK